MPEDRLRDRRAGPRFTLGSVLLLGTLASIFIAVGFCGSTTAAALDPPPSCGLWCAPSLARPFTSQATPAPHV